MAKVDRYLPILSADIIPYNHIKPDDGRYVDFDFYNVNLVSDLIVEFNGCRFNRVHFGGNLIKVNFIDCIFSHCDFSNLELSQSLYMRVQFEHCKGTGSIFRKSKFKYTTFRNGSFPLSDFSESQFENVRIYDCNLSESAFQSCTQSDFETSNVDFTQSDFINTSLAKMDLSGCKIQGLRLSPNHLKGLILDAHQAVGIATLLGIIIKE